MSTRDITIQGISATVLAPYAEGHAITEAEAKALNQVRAENVRNNMATKIKALKEEFGEDTPELLSAAEAAIAEYDGAYEFTLASVGSGRSSALSPVEKEARAIARTYISGQLKELGVTQKEYKEKNGEDAINIKIAEFAQNEKIVAMAEKTIKQRAANANVASELAL